MIKAISSSSLKSTSINLRNTYMGNCNNSRQCDDIFIKSQNSKNISFSGYKGANGYGTQADRNALGYRVQLTPGMIKRNMQSASTADAGVNKNHSLLVNEVNHCSEALASVISVGNDYSNVASARYGEIKKMAPKYANIWVIGAVPQWGSVLTGSFKRKIERCCTELTDDIDDIIHTHVFGNVEAIIKGYNEAHDAFVETLPSLNNNELRNKYMKLLDDASEKSNRNIAFVCGIFNQKREIALANKSAAIGAQHNAQVIRTGMKTVMNTLGGGLVGMIGLDDIIVQAGIPVLSNVMGADLVGHAMSTVSNSVIKSVAAVTLEGLDSSGNLAKEHLSHSKSPSIIKLTEKSLINVLHKIR